jgi:hypothetical protein
LYCDGRLPLYRKITHGQFCSSAHRKAYWQEQERLAVERLHETHDSLQAYRDLVPIDISIAAQNDSEEPSMAPLVRPVLEPEDWQDAAFARRDTERAAEPDAQFAADPPWAGFVIDTMDGATPFCPGWLAPCSELVLIPPASTIALPTTDLAMKLVAAPLPEPQVSEHVELESAPAIEALPEPEAPFAERMRPLIPGSPQRMPAAADALTELCEAMEFPQRARFVLDDTQLDAGLAAAGTVQAVLQAPRAQALELKPVVSHVEPLEVRTGLPSGSQLDVPLPSVALTQPEIRLGSPRDYRIRPEAVRAAKIRAAVEAQAIPPGDVAIPNLHLVPASPFSTDWIPPTAAILPLSFRETQKSQDQSLPFASPSNPGAVSALYLLPQPSKIAVMLPHSGCEILDTKPVADEFPAPLADLGMPNIAIPGPEVTAGLGASSHFMSASMPPQVSTLRHVADFWKRAPRDLRLLVIAIPALIALVFHPTPKVSMRFPQTNPIGGMLGARFADVKQTLVDRAAVALDEDFRSGLDSWVSRGNATAAWSFDATGFVQPGPLALYQPSMGLADYQMQFLGMIDQKALSWVVRASDFENYYVIKMVVLKPGPLPEIGVTRYAVINGKAENRADAVVPISARPDMLYRVRLDASGDDFTLDIQGQVIDSWSEPRLRRGGIGFFSARGEQSRVRWVQVTHQYDMLGRLCAYLAPYKIPNNGSW